jgi:hypothetical protein
VRKNHFSKDKREMARVKKITSSKEIDSSGGRSTQIPPTNFHERRKLRNSIKRSLIQY